MKTETSEWLRIELYKPGDELIVHKLVKMVYNDFISYINTEKGNQQFYEWIDPDKIAARQYKQKNLWLAWTNNQMVGVIEIKDDYKITLLFVDKFYQKLGIGSQLFKKAITVNIENNPTIEKFYVYASICLVAVYKSFGFKVTGKAKKENGIYYVPMELQIDDKFINKLK